MFCPACKAEYRQGFSHCKDCDVDLVYALHAEAEESPGELQVVWEGNDQNACVYRCRILQEAGIRYEVAQIPGPPRAGRRVDWKYKIGVLPEDLDKAKAVVAHDDGTDFPNPDELDGPSPMELPDDQKSAVPEGPKRDRDPQSWFPEDDPVKVWSGIDTGHSWMIDMCLKENRIPFRAEPNGANLQKYFVLPDDENRAREIIAEIEEGRPHA
jgi:hypothetical protein